MFYIYTITNTINNKKYIGQTNDPERRWRDHKSHSATSKYPLYKAIRKYGIQSFLFEVIYKCETVKEIDSVEIKMIESMKTRNKNKGYNIAVGGNNMSGSNNPFYGKKTFRKNKTNNRQLWFN